MSSGVLAHTTKISLFLMFVAVFMLLFEKPCKFNN